MGTILDTFDLIGAIAYLTEQLAGMQIFGQFRMHSRQQSLSAKEIARSARRCRRDILPRSNGV